MTTTDAFPNPDGEDLAELRETIDELQSESTEELVDPLPAGLAERIPTPEITNAIGSEKWDEPADEETTEV